MKAKLLDVTLEDYHADRVGLKVPTLNYSTAKTIHNKSALHAWLESPKGGGQGKQGSKQMDFSQIVHATLLSKGNKAQICDFKDWRTDKSKEAKEAAYAAGLIPLLPKEYDHVMAAATAITVQLSSLGVTLEGASEQAMVWERDGVACRGCMDLWQPGLITEFKMTELPLTNHSLKRLVRNMGYDIQAATYSEGIHMVTGEMPRFRWIFAEMKEPYEVVVATPTDMRLQIGMRKWEKALTTWKACLESGIWEGYAKEQEIDVDMWELREFELSVYPETEVIGEVYAEPSDDPMWF